MTVESLWMVQRQGEIELVKRVDFALEIVGTPEDGCARDIYVSNEVFYYLKMAARPGNSFVIGNCHLLIIEKRPEVQAYLCAPASNKAWLRFVGTEIKYRFWWPILGKALRAAQNHGIITIDYDNLTRFYWSQVRLFGRWPLGRRESEHQ